MRPPAIMTARRSLIVELEDAIHGGSEEKRVATLRRVTDLFLADAHHFNDQQIALFDDLLGHLIEKIESKARVELSSRLAPVENAPIGVIRRLARDDQIAIAGPVLTQSPRLTIGDLVEIAATKSQQHLLAISERPELTEKVTDALLDFGNRDVHYKLTTNEGTRFSESGFAALVKSAAADAGLAEKVGLRPDLPVWLLRELLTKATAAVRSRLLAVAPPLARDEIQRVLGKISNEIDQEVAAAYDFTQAIATVTKMQKQRTLDEEALLAFVRLGKNAETIAALAALCSASIEFIAPLFGGVRNEGLVIACKAAGLKWSTVKAILQGEPAGQKNRDPEFAEAKKGYHKLSRATAQRTLRFWQIRQATAKQEDEPEQRRDAVT
jgi:uncharacterized protein (DUF2336 family)